MRSRESKKRIRSLVLLIAFTTVLLIMSVYAWFSVQKNVAINNLKGRIEVAEGLQLSIDAENWAQSIEFGTTNTGIGEKISNGIVADWNQFDLGIQSNSSYYQHNGVNYVTNNIRPVMNVTDFNRGGSATDSTTGYLVPITTAGALTSDMKHIKFFSGTYAGVKLSQIYQETETVETGMYAFDIYLMNNTKGDKADQLYLNYDSIVREIKSSLGNEDYGLKNCVRVGLAFYSGVVDTSSTKNQILEGIYSSRINQVAIWEPNYDTHSTYVMKQNERLRNLASNIATNAHIINSVYIGDYPVNGQIDDVYITDSSYSGIQTYNAVRTKGEIVTATIDEKSVSANASGIQKIVDIDGYDVKLIANKICKMRVYVWLEGQDPDCINWASHSDGIDVNIGLVKAGAGNKFTDNSLDLTTTNITQETYTWVQYRDETTKTAYVTNGESTFEIGKPVKGYLAGEKGDGNWFILGAENGRLLLTTNSYVATQRFGGDLDKSKNDYANGISVLDSKVQSFKDGNLADFIRSINVKDIDKITGYDPMATGGGTAGVYSAGALYEYDNQVVYRKDADSDKIFYKNNMDNIQDVSSIYSLFTYYNGKEWKTLGDGDKVILSSNYYSYYPYSLTESSLTSGDVKGISLTSLAYNVLFSNTNDEYYWLGSQYIGTSSGRVSFGLRFIMNGYVYSYYLMKTDESSYWANFGIRPAVYLKPNVKIDSEGNLSI